MARPPECARHVSYHAVTRYVQRLLEIELPEPPGGYPTEYACAAAHCKAAGYTILDVQRVIYTPGIALAVSFGVPYVGNGRFFVKIDPSNGVITTVRLGFIRSHRRMRQLSEFELKQKIKKIHRKLKRRPLGGQAVRLAVFQTETEDAS